MPICERKICGIKNISLFSVRIIVLFTLWYTSIPLTVFAGMTSVNNIPYTERVMKQGMYGSDVKELQDNLAYISDLYPSTLVTGYFGGRTLSAVQAFQRNEGIVSSGHPNATGYGQVGPRTNTAIRLARLSLDCANDNTLLRQQCLAKFYGNFAKTNGVLRSLFLINAHITREPTFGFECHDVMHEIGHAASHEYKTLGEAFLHGGIECQNGYYHGVTEEFLRNEKLSSLSPAEVQNICTAATSTTSTFMQLNCVHGVGHAFIYMTNDDLPQSLIRCGDFANDVYRSQCATGAFMEHSLIIKREYSSTTPVITDPSMECVQQPGNQDECYILLSAKVILQNKNGTLPAQQFCDTIQNDIFRSNCVHKLHTALTSSSVY